MCTAWSQQEPRGSNNSHNNNNNCRLVSVSPRWKKEVADLQVWSGWSEDHRGWRRIHHNGARNRFSLRRRSGEVEAVWQQPVGGASSSVQTAGIYCRQHKSDVLLLPAALGTSGCLTELWPPAPPSFFFYALTEQFFHQYCYFCMHVIRLREEPCSPWASTQVLLGNDQQGPSHVFLFLLFLCILSQHSQWCATGAASGDGRLHLLHNQTQREICD